MSTEVQKTTSSQHDAKLPVICCTDCRDEVGITVSLIDAIIAQCRILRNRDLSAQPVQEAIKDLKADEDLRHILSLYGV